MGDEQETTATELKDTPPFLSWRSIYAAVLGALVVEVLLGALLTALYS
jgi:hypothetical protein